MRISDPFAAVHIFYAGPRGIVVVTRSECHKVLYRWGMQRSPIQALLSAKTGEVEAGAEGICEIVLVKAGRWGAAQERLRVAQAV